ncbi:YjcZ family sporulation protein [Bacillus sp. DTU_2020_1000418_1_SI_GHA_SEK_038]|uniref:YjcZ family sporulation protein n=1 Tax=Bacillus sp. DTU_2020_1000418_1_SI_GHA_SEK_038 TaxID=3077585 RepID=UPI0028E7C274|nr:YjcZ family sporulation protein [Bacillus sp. DTU_2020_1000418_1_SI_GHA_SEK_038]WNS74505.1 YjcZ family sporulation protein [Bacillus sp. DTU_2020_1000418_1_SI_GHA_SEK_038]
MYSNVNAPPTLGANVPPYPTYTAPAFDYGYPSPAFGYGYPSNRCDDFILIVVLFILLIIVGAVCCNFHKC